MGWLSDFVSDPIGTLGDTGQKVISNPIPALTAAVTQNPSALLAYGAPTSGQTNQGLLGAAGAYLQNQSNIAGNISAANAAQFRPVGITNNFGTSNFQYDANGGLTGAGYTLNPQLQSAQNTLMGGIGQNLQDQARISSLGRGYLAESPDAVRQRYMEQQNALLAPGNEQTLAGIRNNLFQTGRQGLATGATSAGNMAATNPELAAYYNSLAKQQAQLAAGAEQAAQQQVTYGQGLLSSSYDPYNMGLKAAGYTEGLGQQPFDISTALGAKQATAGANASQYLKSAGQTNTLAQVLGGASGQSLINGLLGGVSSSPWNVANQGGGNSDINTALSGLGEWWNPNNTTGTGDYGLVW